METSGFFLFLWFGHIQTLKKPNRKNPQNSHGLDAQFSFAIGSQRMSPFGGASAAVQLLPGCLQGWSLGICAEEGGNPGLG